MYWFIITGLSSLVYHQSTPDQLLWLMDNLCGKDVIPRFSVPLAELFAEPEL
ncbi:MAG: hypothetical protein HC818_04775 [Synechococcaceae cyanobacterium RM1_1_27]|nr:hypothetical protein [Synechococcaceae cyanobacterium RM1_1_27]